MSQLWYFLTNDMILSGFTIEYSKVLILVLLQHLLLLPLLLVEIISNGKKVYEVRCRIAEASHTAKTQMM